MARRSNLFGWLTEPKTTYHAKIRRRAGEKPRVRDAKKVIGMMRRNPGKSIYFASDDPRDARRTHSFTAKSEAEAAKKLQALRRKTGRNLGLFGSDGREKLVQFNPRGTKGQFERCVEAVESRGGAYDPNAVCAAQERREYGQKELTRRAVAGKRGNPKGAKGQKVYHVYADKQLVLSTPDEWEAQQRVRAVKGSGARSVAYGYTTGNRKEIGRAHV